MVNILKDVQQKSSKIEKFMYVPYDFLQKRLFLILRKKYETFLLTFFQDFFRI